MDGPERCSDDPGLLSRNFFGQVLKPIWAFSSFFGATPRVVPGAPFGSG